MPGAGGLWGGPAPIFSYREVDTLKLFPVL